MRTFLRGKALLFMMLGLLIAVPAVALADVIVADGNIGDTLATPQQTVELGTVAPGAQITKTASFTLQCTGKDHIERGETLSLNFSSTGSDVFNSSNDAVAASGGVSAVTQNAANTNNVRFPAIPTDWPLDTTGSGSTNCPDPVPTLPATDTANITVTAPNAPGTYYGVARWDHSQSNEQTNDIVSNNTTIRYNFTVPSNSAPTVVGTGAADANGTEGSQLTTSGAFADQDTNDTLTITKLSGAGTVTPSTTTRGAWSWSHTPTDNGSGTVVVQVSDGTATVTDSFDWSATNANPDVTLTGPTTTPKEGDLVSYSYSWTDPGSADTFPAAGNSVSCGPGTASNKVFNAAAKTGSFDCTFTDDSGAGTFAVSATVADDDGGSDTDTVQTDVDNANPDVTFTSGPTTGINEGDTKSYSYSWTDPGSADTFPAAGNSVDCGPKGTVSNAVFTPASKTGSFDCTFTDDSVAGTFAVTATVTDDDGGADTDTKNADVDNVNPDVTLLGPTTTPKEGDLVSYSYSWTDPGSADTFPAAGNSVSCGPGTASNKVFNAAAKTGSFDCTFTDDSGAGTFAVSATVTDDDGGSDTDTVQTDVDNALPAVSNLSVSSSTNGVACLSGGNTVKFGFSFTDAGSADTHGYSIAWGDNSANTVVANPNATSPVANVEHTYSGLGPYTITVTVTDDDNGSGTGTKSHSFHYNIGTTLLDPVNNTSISGTSPSLFKVGSTIPLKVNITDCNGVGVTGLSPTIKMMLTSSSTPLGGTDEGVSTQPNDTNWVMRGDAYGQYIYNLASKSPSLPDSSATYKAQITDHGHTVTTQNYFGLKAK